MLKTRIFGTFLAIVLSLNLTAQEDLLPKFPTQAERDYMLAKAQYLMSKDRPSAVDAKAGPDSCEDYCGEQAPAGCWCDPLCVQYGDCCDDYEEFCTVAPPPEPNPGPTPADLVVPGEFEESQAVLLRWSTGYSNSFNELYSKLIDAIQQEVPAWIMIQDGADSTDVFNTLASYGVTLTNYEFLIIPTNSVWTRDYGPWGFYYTDDDNIGIVDLHYYTSRPQDDQVPAYIAQYMGLEYWSSDIRHEGGNLMVDGFGHAYHSTSLLQNNQTFNGWTYATTRAEHESLFRTTNVTEATRLECDGGTGHIDMYAKLFDEESMIVSEYPEVVTAQDRTIIEDNVDLFESESSIYGSPLNIARIPMPLRDNGAFSTTCTQINNDARGYVNGLFVNKTFIVPIYSDESSPQANRDYDEAALDLIRETMPGYNVVGIDARALTPLGGAIHCITMQIPASNPIRFWHPKIAGLQSARANYHILSEIMNSSGIAEAKCMWKIKGQSTWNEVTLVDSSGYFVGDISNQGFTTQDTIIYYLDATSNNGKNMTKPIVAPDGYYTFFFDEDFNPVVDCPGLGNIGDPCDDGDPGTGNDTVQSDCTCQGTVVAANDNCEDVTSAFLLDCDEILTGNTSLAQVTGGLNDECNGYASTSAEDVWYAFNANGQDNYTVTLLPGPDELLDGVLFIYSGSCGNLVEVACADESVTANTGEFIELIAPPAGLYYIRAYNWVQGGADYSISLTCESNCVAPFPQVDQASMASSVNPDNNTVSLSWDPVAFQIGCQIQVRNANTLQILGAKIIGGQNASSFSIPGSFLNDCTEYEWRVRCGCSQNPLVAGEWTAYLPFSTAGCPEITTSPNPTEGLSFVTFEVPFETYTTLEVMDLNGRVISGLFSGNAQPDNEYRFEFDGSDLPIGVYIYRLTTGEQVVNEKFLIAR